MNRPFVTPDDLREYTSLDSVSARSNEQLTADIARAELYVMTYCGQDFSSVEEGSLGAEQLVLAVKLLAEMYAYNAQYKAATANESKGGPSIRSESNTGYSYSLADKSDDLISFDDLGIDSLLKDLCDGSQGDTEMLVTLL